MYAHVISLYICIYVCMDVWMDGGRDGWGVGLKEFKGSYPVYLEKADPRSHGLIKNKAQCMPGGGGGACFNSST